MAKSGQNKGKKGKIKKSLNQFFFFFQFQSLIFKNKKSGQESQEVRLE